ncbi:hypothetical protein QQ045_002340 [Rhodiola kirilowii]
MGIGKVYASYMSATSIAANVSNVSVLNGMNFEEWKENIRIFLGTTDLDLSFRKAKPILLTNSGSAYY